ncbi:MAG: ABC transporter permease [Phycisphaerae bacterium]
MQFWSIILDSLRESRDRKIFWLLIGITLLIALTMLSVGFESDRVTFLFGLWSTETGHYNPETDFGRSAILSITVYLILSLILGWVGIILMLVATAGMIPAMMERGQIDVMLGKPIRRARLFLYKYLAGMVFVVIQATVFVGLTFAVMGLRWGVWAPGYLLAIPLLVLLFSYLYCVSALVGVTTRSTIAAILVSMAAWFVFTTPKTALDTFESFPDLKEHERIYRTLQVCAWIPPKTWDVPYLAAKWAGAGLSMDMIPQIDEATTSGPGGPDAAQLRRLEQKQLEVNAVTSIGSSLLFEGLVVCLAVWRFSRRDF